jgi:hypothetical protein
MLGLLSVIILAPYLGRVPLLESERQPVLFVHPDTEEPVAICA